MGRVVRVVNALGLGSAVRGLLTFRDSTAKL